MKKVGAALQCYHCGNEISGDLFLAEDKSFCCVGCKSVYEILSENNLCRYYDYNDMPGQKQSLSSAYFEYLDEPKVITQLLDFKDEKVSLVTFYIPAIHCSSCLWLLEHLYRLNSGVKQSRVDFLKKQLSVTFEHGEVSLRELVELLVAIGYEPLISLQDVVKEKKDSVNHDLIKKIAVAGFVFGNVMLFSFPEYLGLSAFEHQFQHFFGWLNLICAVVATFYCARDFFVSAWASVKSRVINLDTPLAIIVGVLFLRTSFEIVTRNGAGFADTLCALVFLLLLGRWVKQRAYQHISFNRDYRSYFPVAVTVIKDGVERPVPISDLEVGNRILIRNNEIVPADSILMLGKGFLDFSFVTGESLPVDRVLGEVIYAGGKQVGEALELEIIKPVSHSYLTRLWNNESFKEEASKIKNFNDTIARYFSAVVLVIACCAAAYWHYEGNVPRAWDAFSAVLIVACPCVLALSTPLTLSSVLALFDRNGFYLKNTDVVEQLARVDTVVFDKTGTITMPEGFSVEFDGELCVEERDLLVSAARNSSHPFSRYIVQAFPEASVKKISEFHETPGRGLSAFVEGRMVRLGSMTFITGTEQVPQVGSGVHVGIEGRYVGFFSIRQQWRSDLKLLISGLRDKFSLHLLSGDTKVDREAFRDIFPDETPMYFGQDPHDKLRYVESLQLGGAKVMMVGDGLNDAGALRKSDLGIAVTDNVNNFSPGCDAILRGDTIGRLPQFIAHAKKALGIVRISFCIATVYNLVGVYFAVQGELSPLMAAVLMPLSTITIITFTNITGRYFASRNKLI